MKNKVLLLDSNSLIHRAYHALPNLKSYNGMYTGAIYGFLNILLKLIKEEKPTHIVAAFDLRAPTFRHKLFEEYKGTRRPMDDELRMQIEPLKELVSLMGIKICSLAGYEADDILGTLSKRFDDDTIIVTGDKDSFQLVSDTTRIFWTRKGVSDIVCYDVPRLAEDGFTVASYIDYKALRGDPSDNIPGISGVGEKTAKVLLAEFGSLDNILDNADKIKGKIGLKIQQSREIAELSRVLSIIDCNVPIDCTLDEAKFEPIYSAKVKKVLQEYEIHSLANRMIFDQAEVDIEEEEQKVEIQKFVVSLNSIQAIKDSIKGEEIAILIDDEIKFSCDGQTEYKIETLTDLFSVGINFDEAINVLVDLTKDKKLVCYDIKKLAQQYGFSPRDYFDVMIATHLARESAPIKSVDTVFSTQGLDKGAVEMMLLKTKLIKILENKELDKLFYEIEQPLAMVLKNMQERGFCVSRQKLDELQGKYAEILDEVTLQIYELCGLNFNIASPKQLGEVLFVKLGLKHGKKTKTGLSVGEDVLQNLKDEHPVIELILKFRHYKKLQSTYVVGLQPLITRGKIHSDFNQCITTTGRLSSTNPNLQNIPVRGEDAKDIKSAFIASEGNVLVSADYSQIELRLLAHFSQDDKLIKAYKDGEDIHSLTASQILHKPIEDITYADRRDAKAVNFGIVYGMSDFGLSENLNIPIYKAKEFIKTYFEKYPRVKEYLDKNIAFARENQYALTICGRKRNLMDINNSNYLIRSSAERMAMNTPLQGSASDIAKIAMLRVENALKDMKSKMILQVHDELIIDTDKDEVEMVSKILKYEMENAVHLNVPLIVSVEIANTWGD